MKIYTRTGDDGETALFDGRRVSKADLRVDAYGEIDELNAALGVALAAGVDPDVAAMLEQIQRDLFAVGGTLADPAHRVAERVQKMAVGQADVSRLEQWIDELEASLPPLRRFILPGGSPPGAALHLARTICRRAERRIVVARRRRGRPGPARLRQPSVRLPVRRGAGRQPPRGDPELEW